ncbi:Sushi [Mactra antiquata]
MIDCDEPKITNGNVNLGFDNITTYGATATVTCDTGYKATNETIVCLHSGIWDNTSCVLIDCGDVADINFGNITLNEANTTTFLDNATATVTCNIGYQATNENISCQADAAWEVTFCEIIDCGNATDIDFGNITLNEANTTTYLDNATATVTCDIGYQATNENISCQVDGTWEHTSCEIIDCGDVADIDFGTITLNGSNITTYLDNATATVTCNIGYQATNENISCQVNGTWEDTSCEIIDCGNVADINFGNITLNESNTTTYLDNATATVTCNTGYQAINESISCQVDGKWEVASCVIIGCGDVADVNFGNITLNEANTTTYLDNATATVTCNIGYHATNENISCQVDGTWEVTSCEIIDCGDVADINFGNIILNEANTTTYLDNASATATCNIGYQATNENIYCQVDGKWEVTSCVIIDCGNVNDIDFGNINLNIGNTTTYLDNATATVICNIGYQATNENISCQVDGTWEDTFCEIIGAKLSTILPESLNCEPYLT